MRLPAGGLDALVAQALLDLIAAPNALLDALGPAISGASQQHALLAAGGQLAGEWQQLDWLKLHDTVRATVARVTVHPDEVRVEVERRKLFALLLGGSDKPSSQDRQRQRPRATPSLFRRSSSGPARRCGW